MEMLCKQLADALRVRIRWCATGETPTARQINAEAEVLAAFDAAKFAPEDDALTLAYMAGSASRLDELRANEAEVEELQHALDLMTKHFEGRGAEIETLRNKLDALQRRTSRHSLAKDLGSAVDGDAAIMARMTAESAALKHALERTRDERNRARLEEEKKWKAAQPNLQPLHELVKDWTDSEPFTIAHICRLQLSEALANIQSAGAVKP